MTKMTDAFKKLFLGLGGDAKELAENNDVGDYIEDLEGAIKAYVDEAAGEGKELPTPAAADIGKVVSVVSDGESGAEYSLETPSGGGNVDNKCAIMVTKTGSQMYVTPQGDLTRADILNYLSSSSNDFARMNINAYIYYANDDFTVNATGMVMLNSAIIGANAKLPVFSGIITPQSDSSGTLYQAVFILGATSADDRLEIIPLTTT